MKQTPSRNLAKANFSVRRNNAILGLFCLFTGAIAFLYCYLAVRVHFALTEIAVTAAVFTAITLILYLCGRWFFTSRYQFKKATLATATMGVIGGTILLWFAATSILLFIYGQILHWCFYASAGIFEFLAWPLSLIINEIPPFIQQWQFFFAATYFLLGAYFIYRFYQRQILALKDNDLLAIERVSIYLSLIFAVILLLAIFLLMGELHRWLLIINF